MTRRTKIWLPVLAAAVTLLAQGGGAAAAATAGTGSAPAGVAPAGVVPTDVELRLEEPDGGTTRTTSFRLPLPDVDGATTMKLSEPRVVDGKTARLEVAVSLSLRRDTTGRTVLEYKLRRLVTPPAKGAAGDLDLDLAGSLLLPAPGARRVLARWSRDGGAPSVGVSLEVLP
ncbi:MAG TPA: hypothetical protein VG389_21040 [Myxococcota bacterium]|jgi:hypothetical protein|nr:hypothetical protein [Myxococcota bacterium]